MTTIASDFVFWVRENLFNSRLNAILTLISLVIIIWAVPPTLNFLLFSANWTGGADACRANTDGACWTFITNRFPQFVYGVYPPDERWRVNIVYFLFFVGLGLMGYERTPRRGLIAGFMLLVFPIIAFWLLYGGLGLEIVSTANWGGFMLTLVIATFGIVISLPLGCVLALGRQAHGLPLIRSLSIIFIEFWRGIPLITVLFMSSFMFPLFLPEGVVIDQLFRAMVFFALFSSAYMAEVVRGGLQGLDRGQYEGADSLGLKFWQSMRLIILPQSLKIQIPAIVNTFIGLFKDTTLVLIIGLFDLLGTVHSSIADPNWSISTVPFSGYIFAAFVFFFFCYGMSLYSQFVERKYGIK